MGRKLIHLSQDRVQWCSFVHTVMNIHVHTWIKFIDQLSKYGLIKNKCVPQSSNPSNFYKIFPCIVFITVSSNPVTLDP
jgi:hypothetical protein